MSLVIGDSMFVGGSTIVRHLSEWSGHDLTNRAVVGAGMRNGWVASIPSQYYGYTPTPRTVLMDGGGNDVFSIQDQCSIFSDECRTVLDEVSHIFTDLMAAMGQGGVEDVLFLGPYYVRDSLKRAIDYGVEKMKVECTNTTLPACYFVDIRNLTFPLGWDNVHPTEEGYLEMATAIWDTSLDNNISL